MKTPQQSDIGESKLQKAAVLICRIIVGATFVISGWAKSIDLWGFLYKIEDYLIVWGYSMPREIIITFAGALSCLEFTIGILLLTGSLKRVASWLTAAMMAVMLPLTIYIAIAEPVSDCGCFGDFIVLSNSATMWKNVALSAMSIILVLFNHKVKGLYAAPIQWLLITATVAFSLFLGIYGYLIQPLVDFRPYKTGSTVIEQHNDDNSESFFIYEKDGETQKFALSELPDSTWTFVSAVPTEDSSENQSSLAIYDEFGDEVSDEIISDSGIQVILVVTDPEANFLYRSHYVNELYHQLKKSDIDMIGLVGAFGERLKIWQELTRPAFEIFSVEDTSLKQLVRGNSAIVYMIDGEIKWKRTLSSLDPELPFNDNVGMKLNELPPVDTGGYHYTLLFIYALTLIVIYLLSLSPKILSVLSVRKSAKKSVTLQK